MKRTTIITSSPARKWVVLRQAVLTLLIALLASSCAQTPEITGSDGEPLPGSIVSMERIRLDGIEQWIVIRGEDRRAPVLLWLAGGPGGSEIGWTREYLAALEQDFVFVNWEQPGSGKSAKWSDIRALTPDRFVEQTVLLSEYLAHRFNKRRIVLVGHSWGSIIGLRAAAARPDLYHAYVGVGQQVNARENDLIGYELVLREARARGEERLVARLEEQGPPPYWLELGGHNGCYQQPDRFVSIMRDEVLPLTKR